MAVVMELPYCLRQQGFSAYLRKTRVIQPLRGLPTIKYVRDCEHGHQIQNVKLDYKDKPTVKHLHPEPTTTPSKRQKLGPDPDFKGYLKRNGRDKSGGMEGLPQSSPIVLEDSTISTEPKCPKDGFLKNSSQISINKSDGSNNENRKPPPTNFTPHMGAKRIVVKNLRKTPRITPEEYYTQVWLKLDPALMAIFEERPVLTSTEELYRGVESLTQQRLAPKVFMQLRDRCKTYVKGSLKQQIIDSLESGRSNIEVLGVAHRAWVQWRRQLLSIRKIFYFMDRSYLLHSASEPTIDEMGVEQFKKYIFRDSKVNPKFLAGICDLIEADRRGMDDDHMSLRLSIDMIHDLSVYTLELEPMLLTESEKYYERWATDGSEELDLEGYVNACDSAYEKELARCQIFNLPSSTRRELQAVLEDTLIRKRKAKFLEYNSVARLLEHNDIATLGKLYILLKRIRSNGELKGPWERYIQSTGNSIVTDRQREGEMVLRLLELKRKVEQILKGPFQRHDDISHALRESFANFINEKRKKERSDWDTNNSKPGEMIAKHVDLLLRNGIKAIPSSLNSVGTKGIGVNEDDEMEDVIGDEDTELDAQLDNVLELFRFIEGKDVFEAFYKKDLARRLLLQRSASADAERSMLTKLKSECGSGFTHNLEQMFKDVDLARDEMASYKSVRSDLGRTDAIDLNVNVLSAAAWPTYAEVPVKVPQDISKVINLYDRYYQSKHTGRRLTWKHALAHCIVRAKFPQGIKEIIVSAFQAFVLLLFNDIPDGQKLTYQYIQEATGLSNAELERTLQSLACAKYRVLTKHPRGKDIAETDTFSVNLLFHDPKYRVKINQIQLKETKEENKATHEQVTRDRQYETQAAIVRIMKSRQMIKHSQLLAEVVDATKTRGAVSFAEIKKNIDKLIDKEYMERIDDGSYKYVA